MLSWIFKGIAVVVAIATPLFGVWVASSLAAFANRATWLPVAAGLLLFPGLPLAWEAVAARRRKPGKKRFLTFGDRLILRTLAVNALFLVVLLGAFPERAFVAVSARGDWMLDGRRGPWASAVRANVLKVASGLEWLYRAAHDNPYRRDDDAKPKPDTKPPPKPDTKPSTEPGGEPARRYPWPATLHPVVAAMPPEAEKSIESVAIYIKEREHDPFLRVKALHDWVADRIAYDAQAYEAYLRGVRIPMSDARAEPVFKSRRAVCAGYADLMVALGKITGDEIGYVVGDARSADAPTSGTPHAWNVARIEGHDYLIDATWDAGSVSGSTFAKEYRTSYLFTPPEAFVLTHFPEDARYQLMATPISHAEFFRRPVLTPAFAASGLRLASPNQSQVAATGAVDLVFDNPAHLFLMTDVGPKGGGARTNCARDGRDRARCALPGPGTYAIRFFANTTQSGSYQFAGGIEANAR